jgi:CRISPR-associated protein Cas5t
MMETIYLRVRAPFAAFRWFQAGVYRATTLVMPPSSAYGLILNLAAIEMRDDVAGPITLVKTDLPPVRIAIGVVTPAERCSLYQQLHTYPVGNSGSEFKTRTHGAKYWVAPVRREVVVGLDCIIGVQAHASDLFHRLRKGLKGELEVHRYGLPFVGDNNFLIDRIDEVPAAPQQTEWYVRMQADDSPRKGSCRLTVGINRADNTKTTSFLFAPLGTSTSEPPDLAWTWTPRKPAS